MKSEHMWLILGMVVVGSISSALAAMAWAWLVKKAAKHGITLGSPKQEKKDG